MTEWWEEMFSSEAWQGVQLGWESVEETDDQVDRIVRALRLEPGMRMLDAPCGTGRVSARLAALGFEMVGLDITERFLDEARAKGDGVTYLQGDVREMPFENEFDAVLCFWGSFGYFDDAGNLAQAGAAARALRPGGRLLIDTPSAETIFPNFREKDWFEVEGTSVLMETSYNLGEGRVETAWNFLRGEARETIRTSMRIYTVREMTDLLREAGFSGFQPLTDELEEFAIGSHRLWMVATR